MAKIQFSTKNNTSESPPGIFNSSRWNRRRNPKIYSITLVDVKYGKETEKEIKNSKEIKENHQKFEFSQNYGLLKTSRV